MTPFEVIGAQQCLQDNLIASNSGNILFAYSVYKSLSARGVDIDVNRYKIKALDADEISEKYDAFVIPLANAFRRSYSAKLDALTDVIKRMKIPCVVVGVGAQTNLEHSIMGGSPMDASVKGFVSAVLDRSASIGVRGEFTRDYLKKLGFSSVDVIGCPSMYLNGGSLEVRKSPGISKDSNIAVNLTRGMTPPVCDLFRRTWKEYKGVTYVAQDMDDFKYIYAGKHIDGIRKRDAFPRRTNHPLYTGNKIKLFFNVSSWLKSMGGMDFSFGTRIHGNIFALLAGVPAVVIAHDSRTLELAKFFQIPYVLSSDIDDKTSPESIYQMADFDAMSAGHRDRFNGYIRFLSKNSLPSIYADDTAVAEFEARVGALDFPGAVTPITSCGKSEMRERLAFIHEHVNF